MCEPISTTLLIASAGAKYMEEDAQAEQAGIIADINTENALKSAANQFGAINARVREEAIKAGTTIDTIRTDSLKAAGHVETAAASSGVKGASVEDVIEDFSVQEGKRVTAALVQEDFAKANAEREKTGVELTTTSKLASSIAPEGPSLFGAALSAFASVAGNEANIKSKQDGA